MKRIDIDKEIIDEIDNEENKENRKKIIKRIILIVIPIILLFVILFVSLKYIGPYGLVVKEKAVYSNKINDDLNGLKIIHFGDILFNEQTNRKQIDKLIQKINYVNPDIVIFTGDLISKDYTLSHEEKEFLMKKVSSINANISKIAIKGELDNKMFEEIFTNNGFEVLEENTVNNIYIKNSYILISNFNSNVKNIFLDDELYNIVLTHNPIDIKQVLKYYKPDIILSGHNLNGQIRIPLIGGLFEKSSYLDEYYKESNTNIFITSGIGTRRTDMRLFNHPSINFIRIRKEA